MLISLLLFTLLGIQPTYRAKIRVKHPIPYIVKDVPGYDACFAPLENEEGDFIDWTGWENSCQGRHIALKNPLDTPVIVTISCHSQLLLEKSRRIPAKAASFVRMEWSFFIPENDCFIRSWRQIHIYKV